MLAKKKKKQKQNNNNNNQNVCVHEMRDERSLTPRAGAASNKTRSTNCTIPLREKRERERAQHSFLSNTWYTRVCALRPLERGATQRTDRKKEIEHKCHAVFIAIVINAHCSCSSFSMKRLMYYICVCLTSNEHKQHSEQKQKGLTQPPRTCRSTASVAIARHSFCKTYYYSLL